MLPAGAAESVLKKAKKTGPVWEYKAEGDWAEFDPRDSAMLEERYVSKGPKAKFDTTDFSFNKCHGTIYTVNFAHMVQVNTESKRRRQIRRKDLSGAKQALWEWWTDEKEWTPYTAVDAAMLEKAFNEGVNPFMTKALSFNAGYDSQYLFDFDVMTQANCDSGTSRKIQRTPVGGSKLFGHAKEEDDGYAEVLGAMDGGTGEEHGDTPAYVADFHLGLPADVVAEQKKRGAQSLRHMKRDYGPMVFKDKHGRKCFDEMLDNEKEFCGEWAVFYHSYSCAAILYEVQAAVGAVLFRFKAEFAGLPRILNHGFKHIPNAKRMLEEFPKWKDQDHNAAFKAVGLCGTSSLLADDMEAPATKVFLSGYSVGSLKGVLEKLLGSCGVPKAKIASLAKDILDLSAKHGLDTSGIPGGKKCKSGRSGHMLQIFLRRELVDRYVYPALPYGVPDKPRDLPLSKYLADKSPIQGQVRITLNPDVFLRVHLSRMFTFSADPTYHGNRKEFIKELVALLDPILGDEDVRVKAARGIFGGKPPDWWTPEDQSEKAAMPASRFAKSTL